MRKHLVLVAVLVLLLVSSISMASAQDEIIFGLVLVGPENDRGWSQAHYEGGLYVEENLPGASMIVFPSLNPADAPETTLLEVVTEMVDFGARVIITASDAFEADTNAVALLFPDVVFINISGDDTLTGEAPDNVGNLMGQMEWGKLIAGCAAGLMTQTGDIGYLGPLINGETRRLASSAYLGARYCYETYRDGDPADLSFTVTWIGFWFNIPGVTLDPAEEMNTFFDSGADVVISGIDTTEAIVIAGQRAAMGQNVFAVPYDYVGACEEAPSVCLGVPYFNWGPSYLDLIRTIAADEWVRSWDWLGPDWNDINNPDTSMVGYIKGEGLTADADAALDDFIAELTAYATNPFVPPSIALWSGLLNKQDGTVLAEHGQLVDPLAIWYLDQILEGMSGASK